MTAARARERFKCRNCGKGVAARRGETFRRLTNSLEKDRFFLSFLFLSRLAAALRSFLARTGRD